MKKYYIIESTKANKNGHVSHLVKVKNPGDWIEEVSIQTGRVLRKNYFCGTLEQYLEWGYKIVDAKDATFTGGWRRSFLDYLMENNLIEKGVE